MADTAYKGKYLTGEGLEHFTKEMARMFAELKSENEELRNTIKMLHEEYSELGILATSDGNALITESEKNLRVWNYDL